MCAISIEEIWRGLRHTEGPVAGRLFDGLRLAPIGAAEGIRAGTWQRQFAARGMTLHQADCLIAAATLGVGASIATANAVGPYSETPRPGLGLSRLGPFLELGRITSLQGT